MESFIIQSIDNIHAIDALSWNSPAGNEYPFLRHEFLKALETSGCVSGHTGWQPHHLLVRHHDTLVAVMPLYQKTHSRGEFVFDQCWADSYHHYGLSYYPKWLTAIPFTPCQGPRIAVKEGYSKSAILKALINHIGEQMDHRSISSWHCLFADDQTVTELKDTLIIREDVQFRWNNPGYRDFQDYLSTFTSKNRKKLLRERRRIQEQGITVHRISGPEVSNEQWQQFFRFYCLTHLKHHMMPYLNQDFFQRWIDSMADQLLLVVASRNNKIVGCALDVIGSDTLYGRYWGCAEEFHSLHFEVCYYQGLEYCIERNFTRYDPGTGGEHKINRGFEPIITHSAHWIKDPHFRLAIADYIQREKVAVEDYRQQAKNLLPFKKPLKKPPDPAV